MYNSIIPAGQLRVPEPVKQLGKIAKETPLLTYKEEQDLFLRYRKYGDRKSYEKIFRSHIRLVNKIARLFAKKNLELFSELQSEGFKALVIAIEKLDMSKARLGKYATYWILNCVDTFFVQNNFGNIHLGKSSSEKRVFKQLKKSMKEPESLDDKDIEKIAKENKMNPETIKDIVSLISYNHSDSRNVYDQKEGKLSATTKSVILNNLEHHTQLNSNQSDQLETIIAREEHKQGLRRINECAMKLKTRDRRIFEKKHFLCKGLKKIAEEELVSFQRVSQIDKKNMQFIQSMINDYV